MKSKNNIHLINSAFAVRKQGNLSHVSIERITQILDVVRFLIN